MEVREYYVILHVDNESPSRKTRLLPSLLSLPHMNWLSLISVIDAVVAFSSPFAASTNIFFGEPTLILRLCPYPVLACLSSSYLACALYLGEARHLGRGVFIHDRNVWAGFANVNGDFPHMRAVAPWKQSIKMVIRSIGDSASRMAYEGLDKFVHE